MGAFFQRCDTHEQEDQPSKTLEIITKPNEIGGQFKRRTRNSNEHHRIASKPLPARSPSPLDARAAMSSAKAAALAS